MKYAFLIAFCVLAIIQWVIPARTMWSKNDVLEKGETFKFKTEPVDPSDPFKGKYITLNFEQTSFTDTVHRGLSGQEPVYVLLGKDSLGFAVIENLSPEEPKNTKSYVLATVYYVTKENDSLTVHLDYPFNEFYMDEYKAPKAETIYRESTRDTASTTYALVKVLRGDAVIENVFINEVPIRQLIK